MCSSVVTEQPVKENECYCFSVYLHLSLAFVVVARDHLRSFLLSLVIFHQFILAKTFHSSPVNLSQFLEGEREARGEGMREGG